MIQTLLLSATSLFLLNSEVFATAESALRRRGIIVQDKETAKKMVKNPELIQEYKEHAQQQGVSPKEYTGIREQYPAPLHPSQAIDEDALVRDFQRLHIATTAEDKAAGKQLRKRGIAIDVNMEAAAKHLMTNDGAAGNLGAPIADPTKEEIIAADKLIRGQDGFPLTARPTLVQLKAAEKMIALGAPALGGAFNANLLAATVHLMTNDNGAGNLAGNVNPNGGQIVAIDKLIRNQNGFPATARPTLAQVNAAAKMIALGAPALGGAFNAQLLGVTVHLITNDNGAGNLGGPLDPDAHDIVAAEALIHGPWGFVTAIARPSLIELKAAKRIKVLGGALDNMATDDQLHGAMELIAGRAPRNAKADPTAIDIYGAGRLMALGHNTFTEEQAETAGDLVAPNAVYGGMAWNAPTLDDINAKIAIDTHLVWNGAALTRQNVQATAVLLAGQHGANALQGNELSVAQIRAVTTARAVSAPIGQKVAWAIQHGFGAQARGQIPAGVAHITAAVGGIINANTREFTIDWRSAGGNLSDRWHSVVTGNRANSVQRNGAGTFYVTDATLGGIGGGIATANGTYVVFRDLEVENSVNADNVTLRDGVQCP